MGEQCCVVLPGKMPLQRLRPDQAVDVGCSFRCLCTGCWALGVAGSVLLLGPRPAPANWSWPPQLLQRLVLTPLLICLRSHAPPRSLILFPMCFRCCVGNSECRVVSRHGVSCEWSHTVIQVLSLTYMCLNSNYKVQL